VPYYRPSTATTAGGPFPDFGVNRNNFYGFVNRDFFRTGQDIGTINAEVQITPDLIVTTSSGIRARPRITSGRSLKRRCFSILSRPRR